jgi:hypothetical protein
VECPHPLLSYVLGDTGDFSGTGDLSFLLNLMYTIICNSLLFSYFVFKIFSFTQKTCKLVKFIVLNFV